MTSDRQKQKDAKKAKGRKQTYVLFAVAAVLVGFILVAG